MEDDELVEIPFNRNAGVEMAAMNELKYTVGEVKRKTIATLERELAAYRGTLAPSVQLAEDNRREEDNNRKERQDSFSLPPDFANDNHHAKSRNDKEDDRKEERKDEKKKSPGKATMIRN